MLPDSSETDSPNGIDSGEKQLGGKLKRWLEVVINVPLVPEDNITVGTKGVVDSLRHFHLLPQMFRNYFRRRNNNRRENPKNPNSS